jgi:hypothetical protein|tara:strand:+ start:82 stop:306 length:225 start_codon:yes stop_codon:yes gene_type:complete
MNENQQLLTTKEVIYEMHKRGFIVSKAAVCRWCTKGTVRAEKVGGQWYILRQSFEEKMLNDAERAWRMVENETH